MNGQAFLRLVIEMRYNQRMWYETHEYPYLNKAKTLEKQVDNILDMYKDSLEKITPTQLELTFTEQ